MAYVITEPCMGCTDRACAQVCPSDCIHEGTMEHQGQGYDMLYINPQDCID
jgi:ferredoxin